MAAGPTNAPSGTPAPEPKHRASSVFQRMLRATRGMTNAPPATESASSSLVSGTRAISLCRRMAWVPSTGLVAVAAIGAAFTLAYNYITPFRDAVNNLGTLLAGFGATVMAAFTAMGQAIAQFFADMVAKFKAADAAL